MGWWDRVKGRLSRGPVEPSEEVSAPVRVAVEDNPWGVEVLDLRPMTQGFLSMSRSREVAETFIRMQREDGQRFRGVEPTCSGETTVDLRYSAPEGLWDGVLFQPEAMEDKWAIYVVDHRIVFARSWTGELVLAADFDLDGGTVHVHRVRGTLYDGAETAMSRWAFDALLRIHLWDDPWPVPLHEGGLEHPGPAGLVAMSLFGRRAMFGAVDEPPWQEPPGALLTNSLLHIALARGDLDEARAQIDLGVPEDALAQDGLPTLTWASSAQDWKEAMGLILEEGCPVDVRGSQGATALMIATQRGHFDAVDWLLVRGADVDAADHRGFTALHRAAEMGHTEVVRLLMAAGADAGVEAMGHTPRTLAELRGQAEIVALIDREGG